MSISTISTMSAGELLDAIARREPTPGGGAVAAMTGALGAALGSMVVSYSAGRKSLAEHAPLHDRAAGALEAARSALLSLADEDAQAYAQLNALWKLPEDDPRRAQQMPAAVEAAIDVPARVAEASLQILRLLEELTGRTNRMLGSDLAIAAILAEAAVRSAHWNVRINLPLLADEGERDRWKETIDIQAQQAADLARRVEGSVGA